MKKLRIIFVLFTLCPGSVALAQYAKRSAIEKTYPARDYIMQQTETRYLADGSVKSIGYKTSWVKASGEIKTVAVRFKDDKPIVSYGLGNENGQFWYKANEAKIYLSGTHNDPWRDNRRSPQYLLTSPQYIRTDKVLGYTAYVTKTPAFELYFAPEVGPNPIKTVSIVKNSKDEIVERVVLEPVKIEFSPVLQEMFATPNLPIDFSEIEQEITQAETDGNRNIAEHLKGLVASLKQKRQ